MSSRTFSKTFNQEANVIRAEFADRFNMTSAAFPSPLKVTEFLEVLNQKMVVLFFKSAKPLRKTQSSRESHDKIVDLQASLKQFARPMIELLDRREAVTKGQMSAKQAGHPAERIPMERHEQAALAAYRELLSTIVDVSQTGAKQTHFDKFVGENYRQLCQSIRMAVEINGGIHVQKNSDSLQRIALPHARPRLLQTFQMKQGRLAS